ncbi:ribonuclease inhibitor [Aestuariibaculum sp. M13]|uniref:ribonuclease inhibitor n=1 Tax=Aestuariibaculum sp. M13 TaxID=2967132 RepID=UPI002159CDA1|nr:ribonuclease inhibitor [Aestuariibaculum sp. M13]MCR8668958.1 ribonuclease inhibitor [Aestuariibaculum sp. M13]
MVKKIILDGNNFRNIPTFYEEINHLFMKDENWKLGQSLDALNDLFYGAYGILKENKTIELVWVGFEKSRLDLGLDTTKKFYLEKLEKPEKFNNEFIHKKLAELESGEGKTYFEIILEIIENHPNIKLVQQ